jgi:hypothetical protein
MLQIMIAENATQRGHNQASVLDAVYAVLRQLSQQLLRKAAAAPCQGGGRLRQMEAPLRVRNLAADLAGNATRQLLDQAAAPRLARQPLDPRQRLDQGGTWRCSTPVAPERTFARRRPMK